MSKKDKLLEILIAADLFGTSHANNLIELFDEMIIELKEARLDAEENDQ